MDAGGISSLDIRGAKADERSTSCVLNAAAGDGGGSTKADVIGGSCVLVGVMLSLNSGMEEVEGITSVSKEGMTLVCFFGESGPKPDERLDIRVVFFSTFVSAPLLFTLCDTFRGDLRCERERPSSKTSSSAAGTKFSVIGCVEVVGIVCLDGISFNIRSTSHDRFSSIKRMRSA